RVKELGNRESQRRPVVRMRVILADIDEQINFTLENRSRFKHQVLIGRNLLQDLAIVDVSKKPDPVTADNPAAATTK
ncbi:MAG: ATP-dependent zinc protease, partial [Nitrosomonas sp.]|nr:ATP-dependent zinc protease [Nitrosomonas sp.]